jgi:NAD(P)-dependent dehydrogenase (short-subunit alcohol dehydrogenase family)
MGSLDGKVAMVAGATRGAGRGIAVELGAAGATVYCTGRSVRGAPSSIGRPETIEETAEMVTAAGGAGLWAQVDHTEPDEVRALFERVRARAGPAGCPGQRSHRRPVPDERYALLGKGPVRFCLPVIFCATLYRVRYNDYRYKKHLDEHREQEPSV